MRYSIPLFALALIALPVSSFANDFDAQTADKARASAVPSYNSWSDFQNQRAHDMNANRNPRHYPDAWQGLTAEEKDIILQRREANMKRPNLNPNERHYPDKWQGLTSQEIKNIKTRNSVRVDADAYQTRNGTTVVATTTKTPVHKGAKTTTHYKKTYTKHTAK